MSDNRVSRFARRWRLLGSLGLLMFLAGIGTFVYGGWTGDLSNPDSRFGWMGAALVFGGIGLGLARMVQSEMDEDRRRGW